MEIPTEGNDIKAQIKTLDQNQAFLAPWNYCQENKDTWDYVDTFATLGNSTKACKFPLCSASDTWELLHGLAEIY